MLQVIWYTYYTHIALYIVFSVYLFCFIFRNLFEYLYNWTVVVVIVW